MRNLKKFAALFTAAAMMVTMAGCVAGGGGSDSKKEETDTASDGGSSESGEVTLSFWSWLPTTDQSEEMIEAFEKE